MKVFLMENSPELRVELVERLNNLMNIEIVGTSDDLDVAMISIDKLQPDIVIFDNYLFPEDECEEDIFSYDSIKKINPQMKLVIVDRAQKIKCCEDSGGGVVDHWAQNYIELEKIMNKIVLDFGN